VHDMVPLFKASPPSFPEADAYVIGAWPIMFRPQLYVMDYLCQYPLDLIKSRPFAVFSTDGGNPGALFRKIAHPLTGKGGLLAAYQSFPTGGAYTVAGGMERSIGAGEVAKIRSWAQVLPVAFLAATEAGTSLVTAPLTFPVPSGRWLIKK
ncbi:hypothetical protein KIPB_013652, partial [Kipferlia bialata]